VTGAVRSTRNFHHGGLGRRQTDGEDEAMKFVNAFRSRFFGITFSLLFIVFGSFVQSAAASWLIDARKFHVSAHGQMSCVDCHYEEAEQELHPDPSNVSRVPGESFDFSESCMMCHDNVMDDLEEGVHGTRRIDDASRYENCLHCHVPHHQPRLGENRMGDFDPEVPRHEQCSACHEARSSLPPFEGEDAECASCHVQPTPPMSDVEGGVPAVPLLSGIRKAYHKAGSKDAEIETTSLCTHCHMEGQGAEKTKTGEVVGLISEEQYLKSPHTNIDCGGCHADADELKVDMYEGTPHADVGCITCHPDAARSPHQNQRPGDCRDCHDPHHDEKTAHDAHINVSCEACHLRGVTPVKPEGSDVVLWKTERKRGGSLDIHDMLMYENEDDCARCHVSGNAVGAASMVLPAKSFLCMPCHAGTFSMGDTITILSLLVFITGVVIFFAYWTSGSIAQTSQASVWKKIGFMAASMLRAIFSSRIVPIAKAILFDVLLQRRLYRLSPLRWLVHGLIFFPFMFRFLWGLMALLGSLWAPGSTLVWGMINKNNPVAALLFDISGLLILLGIVFALLRGFVSRSEEKAEGVPRQDWLALVLIGAIILVGFLAEGLRIAVTGWPEGSGWAFIGYIFSVVFSWASGAYPFLWYLHAALAGAFIAYIPFSRLSHIIVGPVVLAMKAVDADDHKEVMGQGII
jgi:nitrate reductase gamma subunit